jgi:hypothetical protein
VSVTRGTTEHGLTMLRLDNGILQADILPDLGAKIWRLQHQKSGEQLLWHNPNVTPGIVPLGANYDDHFCGGWDELFPNDQAGSFRGAEYPDHGELWSQPWEWAVETDDAAGTTLRLRRPGSTCATIVEKRITLRAGESKLRFAHDIHNIGTTGFDFLWKLHPALRLGPKHVLDVPAKRAVIVHPGWSRGGDEIKEFAWPIARLGDGREFDYRQVPPPGTGTRDFLYLLGLDAGWCALTDTARGVGFSLAFSRTVFNSVWVFLTNGGWRGLDCLVLEPCTAWPKDLDEAFARGQMSHLDPGATLHADVVASVYESRSGVRHVSPDGDVESR